MGSGDRSIIFGESFSETEDWDVISFNGLDSGVTLDLSQLDSNYEAVATTSTAQTVVYVRWSRGCLWYFVFGYDCRRWCS